jgi:hypothetical protein
MRAKHTFYQLNYVPTDRRDPEEMGFEPMVRHTSYADLANQCLQPLSHSSIYGWQDLNPHDHMVSRA